MPKSRQEKQRPARGGETRAISLDDYHRALRAAEIEADTAPLATHRTSVSFSYTDRWGTFTEADEKRWRARIEKRRHHLARRAKLAARAVRMQTPRSRAGIAKRLEKTAAIDNAARAYVKSHPTCSIAQLADHLRREFQRPREAQNTYYQRVYRCAGRIGIKKKDA